MANADSDPGTFAAAWQIVLTILAAIGSVVGGWALLLLKEWRGDRAMLLRHEELHKQHDAAMGKLVSFRETVEKGPYGEELQEDIKLLHRRASSAKKSAEDTKQESSERIARLEAGIEWIIKSLERIEKK